MSWAGVDSMFRRSAVFLGCALVLVFVDTDMNMNNDGYLKSLSGDVLDSSARCLVQVRCVPQ